MKAYEEINFMNKVILRWVREGSEYVSRMSESSMDEYKSEIESFISGDSPVAWMVYTEDGQDVYITSNPTDIKETQKAFPLWAYPKK